MRGNSVDDIIDDYPAARLPAARSELPCGFRVPFGSSCRAGCVVYRPGDCLGDCFATAKRRRSWKTNLSSEQAPDIRKTIAYGSGKPAFKYIAFSALVLAVGLVVALGKKDWLLGAPLAAVAAAAIVWQINGLRSAEPLLRLSPEGLRLNLDGSVFADIPWREVEAISSLNLTFEVVQKRWYDLKGGAPGYFLAKDQYRDVTALQVSEAFADQTILPQWRAVAGTRGLRRFAGNRFGDLYARQERHGLAPEQHFPHARWQTVRHPAP
jgi:hypothetical protein